MQQIQQGIFPGFMLGRPQRARQQKRQKQLVL